MQTEWILLKFVCTGAVEGWWGGAAELGTRLPSGLSSSLSSGRLEESRPARPAPSCLHPGQGRQRVHGPESPLWRRGDSGERDFGFWKGSKQDKEKETSRAS